MIKIQLRGHMEEELKSIDVEQPTKTEPVQPVKNVEQEPKISPFRPLKPAKKPRIKAILITLLVLVLIGASAAAAYMYRDKVATDFEKTQTAKIKELEKDKAALDKKLAESKTTTTTIPAVACVAVAPNATALDNIKASITSGNTAALEGYMAPTVNVILAASEGIGPQTPAQAVTAISNFIGSDNTMWDYNFALPAATLAGYRAGSYKQYFPATAVIGKASNDKLVAFSFDCNAKISTVFLAADASSLD